MLNIMGGFEKDRKEEKKFYALVDFFKLMIIGRLCQGNSDLFYLLDGNKKLDKLIRDIEEENIVLGNKSLGDLYVTMCNLSSELGSITRSQSMPLIEAQKEFECICDSQLVICDYKDWDPNDDFGLASLDLISVLPLGIAVNPEIREILLSRKKQKTIGVSIIFETLS